MAAVLGGFAAGAFYDRSTSLLIGYVVVTQLITLALLIITLRRHPTDRH